MELNTQEPIQKSKLRTTVRLTEKEYIDIKLDSLQSGISVPRLLKHSYYKGPFPKPLFDSEYAKLVLKELRKIGININQTARHLNSGLKEGFDTNFEQIKKTFEEVLYLMRGSYGNY